MTFTKALFGKHISHVISTFMCCSLLVLAGCQGSAPPPVTSARPQPPTIRQFPPSQIEDQQFSALPDLTLPDDATTPTPIVQTTRIGILLPLSGNAAQAGKELRNAAVLAQFEVRNPGILLQFYDTEGTAEGAFSAAQLAIGHGVSLIVGPLFSGSVEAIAPLTQAANVPVLSFATNSSVITNGVYMTGFLIPPQIDRIVSYAAEQGRKKFAILSPDTPFGHTAAQAAETAILAHGGTLVRSALFDPNLINFTDAIRGLANYDERRTALRGRKAWLKRQHTASARAELKRLDKQDSLGEVDFDALILPISGPTLKQVVSLLRYYDVNPKHVKLLGTLLWQDENLSEQAPLHGAWFPAASRVGFDQFVQNYTQTYGNSPSQLSSLAYDMVTLASALSSQPSQWQLLTAQGGFIGVNGAFRLEEDGRVQRMMSVQEVNASGAKIISPAPTRFMPMESFSRFEE